MGIDKMKKILIILIAAVILVGCVYAQNNTTVEINGVSFEIPEKYQNGHAYKEGYTADTFHIICVDDDLPKQIGLWAREKDYENNLTVSDHPARHYYQYNSYDKDNYSHVYFASGNSIFEISWLGNNITQDIEELIKNTPPSKISGDGFYSMLDESIKTYKIIKSQQDEMDADYNYLEAKYHESLSDKNPDDRRTKELLITLINTYS